jgi:hypothetical protein
MSLMSDLAICVDEIQELVDSGIALPAAMREVSESSKTSLSTLIWAWDSAHRYMDDDA